MKEISGFLKYVAIFLAVFVLASCARTGTGTKDNLAMLDVAAAPGTKIFVRNPIASGAQLMRVTLNGVKIADLGAFEAVVVDTPTGENILLAQYFGRLTSPAEGGLKEFTMAPNQKRFYIARYERVSAQRLLFDTQQLVLIEIPQGLFFRY